MEYSKEVGRPLDRRAAHLEASRCLLCIDPPCSKACPAGTDPGKFIRSLRFLNEEGAAYTIRINNVLGSLCARLCPTESLCQSGCIRAGLDNPIDIGGLQTYLTDLERENKWEFLSRKKSNGLRVAVVGSGPSGLAASAKLAELGYSVDLIEKEEKIGGVLRYGIPEYRLPSYVLDYEIERISKLGVNFLTNKEVGKDIDETTLKKDYDAVVYCVGYNKGKILPMFEGSDDVVDALSLLKEIRKDSKGYKVPSSVLVVGGGDVAMDVVTSLSKLGCPKVICVAYEELHEIKASRKEREEAFGLLSSMVSGYMPVSHKLGETAFKHRFLDGELSVKTDLTVLAVGQYPDHPYASLKFDRGNAVGMFHCSDDPKVFFAGDIAPEKGKLVVHAVKSGKEAALMVDVRLGGSKNGK